MPYGAGGLRGSLLFARRAYRTLQGAVQTYPVGADACEGSTYNRLNADYEPMHALCRFFLENSGPPHEVGDRSTLPFLVNMPRLYELFVVHIEQVRTGDHLPNHGAVQRAFHFDHFDSRADYKVFNCAARGQLLASATYQPKSLPRNS